MKSIVAKYCAVILVILVCVQVSGCAYLKPHVDEYQSPAQPSQPVAQAMPQLSASVTEVDRWARDIQQKRDEITQWHRALDVATFGLAVGAVVAPIYNAYHGLTTGLALGAGASYAANTLFWPYDISTLHTNALAALSCIETKAATVQASVAPEGTALMLRKKFQDAFGSVSDDCRQTADYIRLTAAFNATFDSMQRVNDNDYAAGVKVAQAGRNVVVAFNKEIDKRAPSPDAILLAAKSLVSLSSVSPSSTSAAAKSVVAKGICDDDVTRFARAAAAYDTKRKTLDDALDSLNDLNTACTFTIDAVPDLVLSQTEVVLAKDITVNIVISGGRPPYNSVWETDPTNNGVTKQEAAPTMITLQGSAMIKTATTYKLDVRDSSVTGRVKVITVTTKAGS